MESLSDRAVGAYGSEFTIQRRNGHEDPYPGLLQSVSTCISEPVLGTEYTPGGEYHWAKPNRFSNHDHRYSIVHDEPYRL